MFKEKRLKRSQLHATYYHNIGSVNKPEKTCVTVYRKPFLSTPSFTTNLELARFEIDAETSGEHVLLPRISTIQSY